MNRDELSEYLVSRVSEETRAKNEALAQLVPLPCTAGQEACRTEADAHTEQLCAALADARREAAAAHALAVDRQTLLDGARDALAVETRRFAELDARHRETAGKAAELAEAERARTQRVDVLRAQHAQLRALTADLSERAASLTGQRSTDSPTSATTSAPSSTRRRASSRRASAHSSTSSGCSAPSWACPPTAAPSTACRVRPCTSTDAVSVGRLLAEHARSAEKTRVALQRVEQLERVKARTDRVPSRAPGRTWRRPPRTSSPSARSSRGPWSVCATPRSPPS